MYSNHYNFNPMRPRLPPEYPFDNFNDFFPVGYDCPPMPYQRYLLRHPPLMRSEWRSQPFNRQFPRMHDHWIPNGGGGPTQRRRRNNPEFDCSYDTARPIESLEEKNREAEPSTTDEAIEKKSNEAVQIKPKISAKEMWESSYREQVPDANKYLEIPGNEPAEPLVQAKNMENRKRKPQRFQKGNHWRKGKKKAKNCSESGDSSTAASVEEEYPKTCTLCKVQLNDEANANEHYNGEVHKKNSIAFLTGQDTTSINNRINKAFGSMPHPTNTPPCLSWDEPGATTTDRSVNTVRFCALCSVRMTSLITAKQHYEGKFHAKKIRIVERGNKPHRKPFKATQFVSGGTLSSGLTPLSTQFSYTPASYQQIQNSAGIVQSPVVNIKATLPPEFANSMTPSGQFYCQTCNVTIEHIGNLKNHVQSKAHKLAKFR